MFTIPARTTAVFVVKAEDVPQATPTVVPTATSAPQPTKAPPTAVPTQALTAVPTAKPAAADSTSSPLVPIVVGSAIVIAAALAGLFVYRRRSQ